MSKYGVFFWSVFSSIWTEYGNLLGKSPYSFRIQENTDQTDQIQIQTKKLPIWKLFTQCKCKNAIWFVEKPQWWVLYWPLLLIHSSNINEVIRSVLNFLLFSLDKIAQVQKSAKRIQGTKRYQKAPKSIKTPPI